MRSLCMTGWPRIGCPSCSRLPSSNQVMNNKGRTVMQRNSRWLAAMAVVSLLLGWAGLSSAAVPERGGTLRVSYGNKISNLDFHTAPGYEMQWVAMNIGCGLVNITADGEFVG